MKKLNYLCLGFLVVALLAIPAAAQRHHGGGAVAGNNSGINKQPGPARSDSVQHPNGDKDRDDHVKHKKKKKTKKTKENEGNHKAEGHENP